MVAGRGRVVAGPPLRVGIVGCGEVTRDKHLPALQRVPTIQVVALADIDPNVSTAIAARFGIARCYQSIEEMMARDPGIEAIGVCVPPSEHVRVALRPDKESRRQRPCPGWPSGRGCPRHAGRPRH